MRDVSKSNKNISNTPFWTYYLLLLEISSKSQKIKDLVG